MRLFSSTAETDKSRYQVKHIRKVMDPKYYENDFVFTRVSELEFIQSPLYD